MIDCTKIKNYNNFKIISGVISDTQIEELLDFWNQIEIGTITNENTWDTNSEMKTKIDADNRVVEIVGVKKGLIPFLTEILFNCFECVTDSFELEGPHYFTYYPLGGKHSKHKDFIKSFNREWVITLMLNDDFEGGDLIIEGETVPKEKGSVIIYDGNTKHEVTPVTKGQRFVITECAGKI